MNFIGNFKKFSTIKALPNATVGDIAFCEERNEWYEFVECQEGLKWKRRDIEKQQTVAVTDLYTVNKQFYESQSPITDKDILEEKIDIVNNYHDEQKNKHYMLLCKELSYFTIFKAKHHQDDVDFISLGDGIVQLFVEQDWEIYDIYKNQETGAIEIWVRDPNHETDNEIHCMLLFGYDLGVVTFGGY